MLFSLVLPQWIKQNQDIELKGNSVRPDPVCWRVPLLIPRQQDPRNSGGARSDRGHSGSGICYCNSCQLNIYFSNIYYILLE